MLRTFLSILFLVLFVSSSSAQTIPIHVQWMDHGADDPAIELNRNIGQILRNELQSRGIPSEGQGLSLFFRAQSYTTSESDLVLLSLVEGHGLNERIVEAGAKNQIWYAGQEVPENANEGTFVREYMTREILSNQVQVTNIESLVVPSGELSRAVSQYLDELFERMRCVHPDQGCN
jgi:hypothetical protein